jgi:hypothetical protein
MGIPVSFPSKAISMSQNAHPSVIRIVAFSILLGIAVYEDFASNVVLPCHLKMHYINAVSGPTPVYVWAILLIENEPLIIHAFRKEA